MLKKIKFTTTLYVAIVTVTILAVLIPGIVNFIQVNSGLVKIGKSSIVSVSDAVLNSLELQNKLVQEKLNTDLSLLTASLKRRGGFSLDKDWPREEKIINQVTKVSEEVTIPSLKVGEIVLNNSFGLVDNFQEINGGTATIFQVLPDKLLRISTNVRKQDGKRAVGTYIPASSPVYQTVMRGETFKGRAYVVDAWYLTAYQPMRDAQGNIVAVIYVGKKILTPAIKQMLDDTKAAGKGYFFVYNSKGDLLLHPNDSLLSNNFFELPVTGPLFEKIKNGFIEYEWDGEEKLSYVQYFEPWDWYVGVGLTKEQMLQGLNRKIMWDSLLTGAIVLVLGLVLAFLIVRFIRRPLHQMASQSIKVADGDYTCRFDYVAKDAIGELATSLNTMIEKSREVLGEITNGTEGLASSSTELRVISENMTSRADQTANLAENVTSSMEDMNANMHSVSAAMEQASINITTVATAAEQMSSTISEIAQNTENAREVTTNAVSKAQQTSARVDELGVAAKDINAVTETITAISSQTNLLALNATIEAARAGEAGKGFAVVANEIKELAQQTAEATEEIRQKIQGIQSATQLTVQDIAEITGIIEDMHQVMGGVAAAIEEQTATTRDIADNVSQASMGISEINENVARSSTMAEQVSSEIVEVNDASAEMSNSSSQLMASAQELSTLAERLKQLVGRFKME